MKVGVLLPKDSSLQVLVKDIPGVHRSSFGSTSDPLTTARHPFDNILMLGMMEVDLIVVEEVEEDRRVEN